MVQDLRCQYRLQQRLQQGLRGLGAFQPGLLHRHGPSMLGRRDCCMLSLAPCQNAGDVLRL